MPSILTCTSSDTPCPADAQVWLTLEQLMAPADLGVTPSAIFQVWGWGFSVVIFFWFLGYCTGIVVDAIRRA